MRLGKLSVLSVIVLLSVLVMSSGQSVHASTSNATITTDQSDYLAGSTVTIYGSAFAPAASVTVSVTDPNNGTTTWSVTSDSPGGFTTTYVLDHVIGNYFVTASDGFGNSATTTFHDGSQAATLDQCRNGGVTGLPGSAVSCNGSVTHRWENGNAGASDSHWREGDFLAYRVTVSGLTAGVHTLDFHYKTVDSSKHAIDYLGSVNGTETFSPTPSTFNANNNNPCNDPGLGIPCTPSSPAGSITVPPASLVNCAGSSGTFSGTQVPGKIFIYGASGTTLVSFTYLSQNSPGSGGCFTFVQLNFTSIGSGSTVVIAWGGHIASQANWGIGNSASFISGSPYHMALDTLDGASTGSQDRSLATSAIFFTPTISTVVINDSTGLTAVSPLALGTSVHDTATLSGASASPTGTVNYKFYTNGICSGTPSATQTVTLSSGAIPNSASTGPLGAGSYSYNATYSGDSINFPKAPNSACEPFTVAKAATTISTTVVFKSGSPISSPLPLGSVVNDTSTVSGQVGSIPATGTVTYRFFSTNTCTGTFSSETVSLSGGLVPNSSQHGPLAAGLYSFNATYNGDNNYFAFTSSCEPFQVGKTPSSTATAIHVAPSGTTDVTGTTQPLGTSLFDTATVTGSPFTPTGTMTYYFFTNGGCTGTATSTQTVALSGGVVPNSSPTSALQAGSYSFQAVYSGDGNYNGSTSSCESITIAKGTSNTATVVFDASTNAAWSSTESTGASAYDTASVTTSNGFTATGTVTYTFFSNGSCSGTGSSAGTVTLTSTGTVPNSNTEGPPLAAGMYSFQAIYSGDSNYSGSTSACEPFSVAKGSSTTATVVFDAATNAPWSGTETTGASAFDTATVTTSDGLVATGTVSYFFYTNNACSGTGVAAGVVNLSATGSVPNSSTEGLLPAGMYSFQATYSGDSNYSGSTSSCEPFTVNVGSSTTVTTIFDASTNAPWSGTETTGASAYDTAHVSVSGPFPPSGSVTYLFYKNVCGGPVLFTLTLPLSGGMAPNSNPTGPLAAGSYAFLANYSGDSNYVGSTSNCEPFAVAKGSSTTATVVFDAATNAAWTGTETTGASAYDTATVTPSNGFTATGTVTYTFFTNNACTGSVAPAGIVTLTASGSVPNSSTEGPLVAGSYSFQATYSGDSNYSGSTSSCEPFTVNIGSSATVTFVFDASTNSPWTNTETTGASAYDTAHVAVSGPFPPTGTVTFMFYQNGCGGPVVFTQTVPLSGMMASSHPTGPLAAGSYAFQATYNGDPNYTPSTSPCEPFAVNTGSSTTATVVYDAATNAPWSGTETTGASAYDTASVSTSDGFTATGTVSYVFFTNGSCSGSGASAGTVTLTATGTIPKSNTEGPPLAAGSYSFQASYSGDSNYSGSTSGCEPFSVAKASSNTATVVFDAATNAPWTGTETTGASAYDTASVTTSDTIVATGTVSYIFFNNNACFTPPSGKVAFAGLVTLTATGVVPNSNTEGPLAAGSYSFQAGYSGDSNYSGSSSPCEPFTVAIGSSTTKTVVFDATTNSVWSGTETTGASAYDSSTVTTSDTIVATGTVTYTFYSNGGCTGTGVSAGTVTLTATGTVPNSNTEGPPLAAGSYSFKATYSGDSNYSGASSPCEPFTVNIGSSTIATVVFDASTNAPWSGTETTGASAYDTATVTTSDTIVATGTVEYTLFGFDGTCSGTLHKAVIVTLTATGTVPNSVPFGPLFAGSYSFQATYSGDSNYSGSTSPCEPFTVNIGSSTTVTTVFDGSTNTPWSGTETTGASAYDTASVTPSDGFVATGTVSYTFYKLGDCSGTGLSAGIVTMTASGAVPNSSAEGPLAAGSYSFQATYSGDSNYSGSTSTCEPFRVNIGSSTTATVVYDASTKAPWTGTESTGGSAYDTAIVTTSDGFTATGTVSYTFFSNGSCSGTGASAGTVTLTGTGTVPISNTEGPPLAAGMYSFQAVYSGDSNYSGSTSPCEPFAVAKGSSTTATVVFDAASNAAWTGTETTGASAYDTSTVTTTDTIVATGTVSYTFYTGGTCSGTSVSAGTVTLTASGSVPNSSTEGPLTAGSYAFQATYSGDSNYSGSTSSCEPITVNIGSSTTTTAVFDAANNAPWSGTETTGASAYDTATVTSSDGFTAIGTVSYTFFANNACSGSGSSAGTVTLTASGTVPNSNTEGPLAAGSYSFQATYSGDSNYSGSTSPCEPFAVNIGSSATVTFVFDASTNVPWSGTETTGASAYDNAHVSVSGPFPPTGTVTFTFYVNGCGGPVVFTQTVPLSGMMAVSHPTGPLMAGSYAFQATYNGDPNYTPSTSQCEPFNVRPGTSQVSTTVFDAATNAPWTNSETTGASAYDTAHVSVSGPFPPTGTVTYTFYQNGCGGTVIFTQTVTLGGAGMVPNSHPTGPLMAGSYAFQASYSGDSNYSGSTSACEPFAVNIGSSTTSTIVYDASTNAPWTGTESTGASAYDTALVTTSDGFTAAGTVSYTFFSNASCSGTGVSAGTVILTATGTVPISNTEGPPLAAGMYSFQAVYSGDSNYSGSTSGCEPFTVAKGSSTTATVVFDASTNAPWTGTETTGASAYDTASVTISDTIAATGTVQYNFFTDATCSGTPSAQTVTLTSSGSVPNSNPTGPLTAGSYSFEAVYSGDTNYGGSTSPCEPFTVNIGSSTTATTVFDASTNAPWTGSETTGSSAYDTASVTPSDGFTATGTVSYTFFSNGSCSGTGSAAGTVTLTASGSVPNSSTEGPLTAGSYSFQATYSGDSNYSSSTSPCEPFNVRPGTSQVLTTVFDAATNAPWTNTESTGASAYDTAHVIAGPFPPTGTVTFTFYVNGCGGPVVFTQTVPLSGMMASSHPTGPLTAGNYAFLATYNGDPNYTPSTSPCEPFNVRPGTSSTATVVLDATTNAPWTGSETTGASAYDTAHVSVSAGPIMPTGTVTYTFYSGGCSGSIVFTQTVPLLGGLVPPSHPTAPLAAGNYAFQATYSGDPNFSGSTSPCEPFHVAKGSSTTATSVFDASTNTAWSGSESTGASASDTATVTVSSSSFTATGTVSYTFYTNGACSGTGSSAGTVTLTASGSVPNSNTEGPLAAGSYSFHAVYSGDSNYNGSTSPCEPFNVNIGSSHTNTFVFDASTNAPWTGIETTGASAYDTSTVTTSDTIVATGTVQYDFFANIGCSGTPSAQMVTLTPTGSVPNSATHGPLMAGSYSFQAVYSSDTNYSGSTSPCEPFTVQKANSNTNTHIYATGTTTPDIQATTQPLGTSVYDTASVTASPFAPTGSVTYTFFRGGCGGTIVSTQVVTLTSGGAVPNSQNTGALMAGSYSFQAVYSGDSNYNGSTSPCETLNISKDNTNTTTALFTSTGQSIPLGTTLGVGTSVYDVATVTGVPSAPFSITGTVTYSFYHTINCSGATFTPGSGTKSVGSQSDATGSLGFGDYSFNAVYNGDNNYNVSPVSSCEPFSIRPLSAVTDTMFCPIPNNQVNLIYVGSGSGYILKASNPGQFYYNIFFTGAPGTTETLTITIPYPFVTQGAVPIQAHSTFTMNGSCFLPGPFTPLNATGVGFAMPLSPSGYGTVVLSNYGGTGPYYGPTTGGVSFRSFTVTEVIPSTGLFYVTVHLDYGLKGQSFVQGPTSPTTTCSPPTGSSANSIPSPSTVIVAYCQSYSFAVHDTLFSDTQGITTINTFKKDPGIAGIITDQYGDPIAGVTIKIYDNNGYLLGITTTDQNGVYLFQYKYTGAKVQFTVVATLPSSLSASYTSISTTNSVTMQSNKLAESDLTFTHK